jgi:hypothetical protein
MMKNGPRRVIGLPLAIPPFIGGPGRVVGMGLAWAVAWAPIAVLIGTLILDPDNSMDEMWPVIGAYPGFLCGVLFCAVLAIAERGRRLEELHLSRAALWGTVAGLLVGALPFAIGDATTELPPLLFATIVIGSIALLSAASAVASVLLRRSLRRRVLRRAR